MHSFLAELRHVFNKVSFLTSGAAEDKLALLKTVLRYNFADGTVSKTMSSDMEIFSWFVEGLLLVS